MLVSVEVKLGFLVEVKIINQKVSYQDQLHIDEVGEVWVQSVVKNHF